MTLREAIKLNKETDKISDGYHTFGELYDHRRALTVALTRCNVHISWKSKKHHPNDVPMFEGGYFVVGMNLPAGQISYHFKLKYWDYFKDVTELPNAPRWDGHTPEMVISRLLEWDCEFPV